MIDVEKVVDMIGPGRVLQWAADCVEHVLPIYERADVPNYDKSRFRTIVDYARRWPLPLNEGGIGIAEFERAWYWADLAAKHATTPAAMNVAQAAGLLVSRWDDFNAFQVQQLTAAVRLCWLAVFFDSHPAQTNPANNQKAIKDAGNEWEWQTNRLTHYLHDYAFARAAEAQGLEVAR